MAHPETRPSEKTSERGRHQIGEVAERLGLSLRTIRHYDEEGLVTPSARTEGGFRLYGEEDIERLALIKRMKPLGFSLDEMRDLLAARDRLATTDGRAEDALDSLSRFAAAANEKSAQRPAARAADCGAASRRSGPERPCRSRRCGGASVVPGTGSARARASPRAPP
jgi:MerR family copper efflux transcriptional regulator